MKLLWQKKVRELFKDQGVVSLTPSGMDALVAHIEEYLTQIAKMAARNSVMLQSMTSEMR